MTEVSIRELRHHGGDVVDRVASGERITITRDGAPVAELRAVPKRRLTTATLIEHRRHLPAVDPRQLRADVDSVIDSSL